MPELGLFIFAFICETASVSFPVILGESRFALAAFLLLHLAGTVCLTASVPLLFTGLHGKAKLKAMVAFSFTLFIPFFGALGMLLILLHLRFGGKRKGRPEFHVIPQLPFTVADAVRPLNMGEGGAWDRLKAESVPRRMKLEALMAAGMTSNHNANLLLRLASGDMDDEIRLLAFNFFDKREKTISASISRLLGSLKDAVNDREKGDIHARLAFSYWEFHYNELAGAELKGFYLDQALSHARQAEQLQGEDHRISMLVGRIMLRRGRIDEAERAIARALELGVSPDKGVPFQAEILYLKRDFTSLRELLAKNAHLRHKPVIGAVVSFWTGA